MNRTIMIVIGLIAAGAVVIAISVTVINRDSGQHANPVVPSAGPPDQKQLTNEDRAAELEGARVLERSRERKPTKPIHGMFPTEEAATQSK
jgi:hypothetical protein